MDPSSARSKRGKSKEEPTNRISLEDIWLRKEKHVKLLAKQLAKLPVNLLAKQKLAERLAEQKELLLVNN